MAYGGATASLSAKLAIGGDDFSDIDLVTFVPVQPVVAILEQLWEFLRSREVFRRTWMRSVAAKEGVSWRRVTGPISAAFVNLDLSSDGSCSARAWTFYLSRRGKSLHLSPSI